MKRMLFALLAAATLLCGAVCAQAYDYREELRGFLESGLLDELLDRVPETAQSSIEQQGAEGALDAAEKLTPQGVWRGLVAKVKSTVSAPLRMLAAVTGIVLICVLVSVFSGAVSSVGVAAVFEVIAAAFTAAVVIAPVTDCIQLVVDTTAGFSEFIALFIPLFAGVLTAAGQPLTAAAYNLFLFAVCQAFSALLTAVFVPLLCGYLALSLVSAAAPQTRLASVASGIKSFVTWSLTLTLTLFVGLLSVQSAIAAGGDTLAVRTTRFFISSFVPVVGRALSDAFSAAQGCMQLVKSTLGAAGVVVTAATFLPVLIEVAVWYAALYAGGLIAEMMGAAGAEKLLKAVAGTLGILMAVLLFYLLLVVVSTTLMIVAFQGV